jgi:hypothetical protein
MGSPLLSSAGGIGEKVGGYINRRPIPTYSGDGLIHSPEILERGRKLASIYFAGHSQPVNPIIRHQLVTKRSNPFGHLARSVRFIQNANNLPFLKGKTII